MKACSKCEISKPYTEFHRSGKTADGLIGICKKCRRIQDRARYDADPSVRERMQQAAEKWKAKNEAKRQAHIRARAAVRAGKLSKRPCEVCGSAEVDAHHDDYSIPLKVRWLCRRHHRQHHAALKAAGVDPDSKG